MTLSSYRNTTCSRHDIAEKLLAWCLTTITHSLYVLVFEISMLLNIFEEYEVNDYYSLVLQVEDQTMPLTGSLIIRVRYILFL
jgi:hypothetical protein